VIDIWPWFFVAIGLAMIPITAYFIGVEVGIDRQKRKEEGKP
jgi:hypothetical protein